MNLKSRISSSIRFAIARIAAKIYFSLTSKQKLHYGWLPAPIVIYNPRNHTPEGINFGICSPIDAHSVYTSLRDKNFTAEEAEELVDNIRLAILTSRRQRTYHMGYGLEPTNLPTYKEYCRKFGGKHFRSFPI